VTANTRIESRQGLRVLEDKRIVSLMLLVTTVVCAQVRIGLPFTEVPLTGQTFAVLLTGMVAGTGWGAATQGVYLALGAAGLPIYAGATGGWGALSGPTGGYLVGFVASAWLIGRLVRFRPRNFLWLCLCGAAGSVLIYVFGAGWYSLVTGQGVYATLLKGVVPFVPGDGAKLVVAATLAAGYHHLCREPARREPAG